MIPASSPELSASLAALKVAALSAIARVNGWHTSPEEIEGLAQSMSLEDATAELRRRNSDYLGLFRRIRSSIFGRR